VQAAKGAVDHQAPGSTVHRLDGTEVPGSVGDTEPWDHWPADRLFVGTLVPRLQSSNYPRYQWPESPR
jgi:hypothetical protein